jgi:hypothetical protein
MNCVAQEDPFILLNYAFWRDIRRKDVMAAWPYGGFCLHFGLGLSLVARDGAAR